MTPRIPTGPHGPGRRPTLPITDPAGQTGLPEGPEVLALPRLAFCGGCGLLLDRESDRYAAGCGECGWRRNRRAA